MSRRLLALMFLCLFPVAVPLFCYTCVFPALSPLDCIRFPQKCPPGHRCLSSKATAQKGDIKLVLYEKSCVLPILCNLTGEKYAMGLNFTFTNDCCDTHLCNKAPVTSTRFWSFTAVLFFLCFATLQH
ncbi:sperm acrosome membrane-associated protein 4-like [Denticeps clupeoides]|uniref:UPAR/Ly6 domain-containing protein n=1 Tax=Denticeps clupeoides TaxID=299321 RepID=A0AAY4E676_9TELE|nr:protein Bouncer-like [Denticeps clupeoides]